VFLTGKSSSPVAKRQKTRLVQGFLVAGRHGRDYDDLIHALGETAVYERFTDQARKVMPAWANQEAQRFNHELLGTEHILLGLVAVDSGVAARR